MRTLTRAGLAGAIIAVIVYGLLNALSSPDPMPKPHHTKTNADGRVIATVQLCWWPQEVGGVINTQVGPARKTEVEFNIDCRHPWSTSGLVARGDRISLGWTMNPSSPSTRTVDFRVTINNREAKRATRNVGNGLFECMVGVPPCTL